MAFVSGLGVQVARLNDLPGSCAFGRDCGKFPERQNDFADVSRGAPTQWTGALAIARSTSDHHDVNVGGPGTQPGMPETSHSEIIDFPRFETRYLDTAFDLGELPLLVPARLVIGITLTGLDDVGDGSRDPAQPSSRRRRTFPRRSGHDSGCRHP